MALVVEDGSGLSTAESYASVSEADAYHTTNGNSGWTGATSVKEQALRNATRYLESKYGPRFFGVKKTREQALIWPMDDASDIFGHLIENDVVPTELKNALFEAALVSLSTDLLAAVTPETDASIVSESKTLGPMSISKTFSTAGKRGGGSRYPKVDAAIRPLVAAAGQVVRG